MVLCGFCMAENPVKTPEIELEVETRVSPEVDPSPMADGKTSASEMSAYFDGIFGKLGNWLAYVLSDNRPIEPGNVSSAEVFMSGDRAAAIGDQYVPNGRKLVNWSGSDLNPDKPLSQPGDNQGPRIEIKSGSGKGSKGQGIVDDLVLRHSKAAIDRYFTANVLRAPKGPAKASRRLGSGQSKMSVKAFRYLSDSAKPATTFAMQAVPEPSSTLFFSIAAVICTCIRRRPISG